MLEIYETSTELENAIFYIELLEKELKAYEGIEKTILNRLKENKSLDSLSEKELTILVYLERLRYELNYNKLIALYEDYRLNKEISEENGLALFNETMKNPLGYLKVEELFEYFISVNKVDDSKHNVIQNFIRKIDYFSKYIYRNKKLPISMEEVAINKKYHDYFLCRYYFDYSVDYSNELCFREEMLNDQYQCERNPKFSYIDNIKQFDTKEYQEDYYKKLKNRLYI